MNHLSYLTHNDYLSYLTSIIFHIYNDYLLYLTHRNKDEAEAMLNNKKLTNKYEAIRELRRSKSENLEDNGPAFTGPDVPLEDQWELFCTLCHILHEQKR